MTENSPNWCTFFRAVSPGSLSVQPWNPAQQEVEVTPANPHLRFCFYDYCLFCGRVHLSACCLFVPAFDLQSTEQVAAFCRSLHEMNPSECVSSSPSPDSPFPPPATPRQLSDADKLRKVICELVETERTYVKVSITPLGVMDRWSFSASGRPSCASISVHVCLLVLLSLSNIIQHQSMSR